MLAGSALCSVCVTCCVPSFLFLQGYYKDRTFPTPKLTGRPVIISKPTLLVLAFIFAFCFGCSVLGQGVVV